MTTQTPMTVDAAFAGHTFRTNEGREGTTYFFNGHLTIEEVTKQYFELYPEHRVEYPYRVDGKSLRHAWHVFTAHEDDCYLITDDDPDEPFTPDDFENPTFCTCEAYQALAYDGTGYEYRHPHDATADTKGSIPVTWVTIAPA
ncbi:hypothetical protein [Streptomyces ipomoeae]|uniref:hypothetical protein n=1 Tax=Streptomyces ipomoeae TaxID=103232 RepID=UPI001146379B|nr:hypothetical protein [Streptomyces ipomoeae]TQE33110.1 hypothetical protein Sipo7851_21670 [Streptomyces ipomoeae]